MHAFQQVATFLMLLHQIRSFKAQIALVTAPHFILMADFLVFGVERAILEGLIA
jgi:hypothetical protein